MDSLNVALIGTGFMGKCHALAYGAVKATFGDVPRPIRAVLCDVDAVHTAHKAEEFGFSRWTTDWQSLLKDETIDLVSVTTPNSLHREIVVALLEAGKHVWCEKPMALTLEDAEAMAAAACKSGRLTMLGYNYIKNPAVQHAKKMIAEGTIGDVFDFRGSVDEDYMADASLPWSWRLRSKDAGLGTLGDITCHLVSIAYDLVGEIGSLCAIADTVHKTRPISGEPKSLGTVENDDVAHALIRFRNGARGIMASSRIAHGRKNGLKFEVHGAKGTLALDNERMNELQLFQADGPTEQRGFKTILTGPLHPPYDRFCPAPGHGLGFNDLKVIELAHLLRALRGDHAPYLSFADGLHIEKVIHAFARSSRERGWVDVH